MKYINSFHSKITYYGRIVFAVIWFSSTGLVAANATQQTNNTVSKTTTDSLHKKLDTRMTWWREAKFGMFIHWGVYSVPAGIYDGKQISGGGEWIMCNAKIPMTKYQTYAKKFNPVKYNPDNWVRLAKEAGMKYIVITTKHHDGFAMFKTKASDWNIVKATPYEKDILKPLAAACRKYGIKLGFYYSQSQDWNNGGAEYSGSWDPAQKHDMDNYINKIVVPQVKELLTHYGKFPAVLWWDTPCDMNKERAAKIAALLKLKPNIITNNRLGGDFLGDYETPEQTIPANGFSGHDWETCMTINNTWGFKRDDHDWKSTEILLRNLIDIASKGGNYLLNVGPDANGVIPQSEEQRLKEIGAWLKINGQAIYGTTASPFKEQLAWGRCTQKESKDSIILYLIVFNWPSDGKLIVPYLTNKVVSSTLQENGTKLQSTATVNGLIISVPTNAPDSIASVIKVVIKK